MKISGTHHLEAPPQAVWDALHDPDVLVRTLPGCEALEESGPDSYEATMKVGVGSIKGTYKGAVELSEQQPPSSYRMKASGAGAPGTVEADVQVRLSEDGDGTRIDYEADAVVGGMIGGVGQRMIAGVAKRTAGEFFRAIERDLAAGPTETAEAPAEPAVQAVAEPTAEPARERAEVQLGRVFRASASRPAGDDTNTQQLAGAALTGGLLALAGVLVGRRLGRGRGSRG